MEDEIAMHKRLDDLKSQHQALDDLIDNMSQLLKAGSRTVNELELRRLKNQRLSLRDQMARLEEELYPDIIA